MEIRFLTFRVAVEEPRAGVSLLWASRDLSARRRGHAGGLFSTTPPDPPSLSPDTLSQHRLHLATLLVSPLSIGYSVLTQPRYIVATPLPPCHFACLATVYSMAFCPHAARTRTQPRYIVATPPPSLHFVSPLSLL